RMSKGSVVPKYRNTATIFCINSTNSCNFHVLVDFLHHPTFPRGASCGDFFVSREPGGVSFKSYQWRKHCRGLYSDSNSGLITNSPWIGSLWPFSRLFLKTLEAFYAGKGKSMTEMFEPNHLLSIDSSARITLLLKLANQYQKSA